MAAPAEHTQHLDTKRSPAWGSGDPGGGGGGGGGRRRWQQRAGNCGRDDPGQRRVRAPAPAGPAQPHAAADEGASFLASKPGPLQGRPHWPRPAAPPSHSHLSAPPVWFPRSCEVQEKRAREDGALQETVHCHTARRVGRRRQRCKTKKKRKRGAWRPHHKLSWEEKREVEERETARALQRRAEMFAKGHPMAPYNTTQFLMDEHYREEPDLSTETGVRWPPGVGGHAEDAGSREDFSDHDGGGQEEADDDDDVIRRHTCMDFLRRNFLRDLEMHHVESLPAMSRRELLQGYLEQERCTSWLEEQNNRLRVALESSLLRLRELEKGLGVGGAETQSSPLRTS